MVLDFVFCIEGGQGRFPQTLDMLSYCFYSLCALGEVEVIPGFVFNAPEFLTNTVVLTLRDILLQHGLQGKVVVSRITQFRGLRR